MIEKYWVVIEDINHELVFKVYADGTIEYGSNYSKEKAEAIYNDYFHAYFHLNDNDS
jgi:hypothetical protein